MDRDIKIGILGCARIAKSAIVDPCKQSTGLSLGGVASRDLERATAFADQHGIDHAYGSYRDLLSDPEIDAIYIPLPNSLHERWTIAALEAGKPVLCEKPIAANADATERMAAVARSQNLPLVEAFHYRLHPMALFIDEVIDKGQLGEIREVSATFDIPGDRVRDDDIRFRIELAGGAMMDLGAYCMNAVRWASGEEPTVVAATPMTDKPEIDTAMDVSLAFPSGAIGSIACSLKGERFRAELSVIGEHGAIRAANPFLPHLGNELEIEILGDVTSHQFGSSTTYFHQAKAFAATVRGERSWRSDLEDSIRNMTIIDEVYRTAGMQPRQSSL
ncbi:MAG: Gfo/Idh/MocA family oxidoreductase [Pseudomonadota bacterium]